MKLAPGEGRKPLYITTGKFIEERAYPSVFAGLNRVLPEDLSILKKSKFDILRLAIFMNSFSTSYYYCNCRKNKLIRTLFRSPSKPL